MKLDEEFEPTSDSFSLPDGLEEKLEKWRKGLKRIVIQRKVGRSWKVVNGFAVDRDGTGLAKDPAEHIATMCVAIAAWDVEDKGEEGTFRVRASIEGKSGDPTFSFRQGFGDDSQTAFDAGGDPMAVVAMSINNMNNFIQIQNNHVEAQNARILEMSNTSNQTAAMMLKTIDTLMGKWYEGIAMTGNAMATMFDIERNLELDKQKGKNTEKLIDVLKIAAPTAMKQFGAYMASKTGIEMPDDEDEDDEDEDEDDEESEGEQSEEAKAQAELRRKLKTKPLTTFAHAFKDSLTTDQWFGASDVLTKKQFAVLKKACSQENDNDTAEAILELRDILMNKAPEKLVGLGEVLDEQQLQMILKLNEKAEEFEEAKKKET